VYGCPVEDQRTAGEDEQNHRLACSNDGFKKLLLVAGKIEVCA
jgi:hypothetical protein